MTASRDDVVPFDPVVMGRWSGAEGCRDVITVEADAGVDTDVLALAFARGAVTRTSGVEDVLALVDAGCEGSDTVTLEAEGRARSLKVKKLLAAALPSPLTVSSAAAKPLLVGCRTGISMSSSDSSSGSIGSDSSCVSVIMPAACSIADGG